jgi:hypothetical protein
MVAGVKVLGAYSPSLLVTAIRLAHTVLHRVVRRAAVARSITPTFAVVFPPVVPVVFIVISVSIGGTIVRSGTILVITAATPVLG